MLPRYFKWFGLLLVIAGFGYSAVYRHSLDDVAFIGGLWIQTAILAGLLMIAGAKEKTEDEMIRHIRLTSLQWSVFLMILLRLGFKTVAFLTREVSWLPHIQINGLLMIYLVLFYYQLYVKDYLASINKPHEA